MATGIWFALVRLGSRWRVKSKDKRLKKKETLLCINRAGIFVAYKQIGNLSQTEDQLRFERKDYQSVHPQTDQKWTKQT
jgi:hypothetical protein